MQQLRGIARKGKATRWNLADLLQCLDEVGVLMLLML